ncbi:DUF5700 domain-containing putative Zn-dependent protease [Lutibacter flavus]|uniref:DUF2268 domain-containing protein n=1 Tax=Lutibacter flavus TaxID=691689 RepID=A0A238VKH5_9FLAO|nr:DUF5700 domain-containing putative Zn-dependent protease [Lutibacter flavus]SNR34900.1 hypothetical protein SAMN04488111_0650 [Lutibacter flavus]
MKNILVLLCIFLLSLEASFGQKISDKGLQIYWEKMQNIESGKELSNTDLMEIWNSPGYNYYNNQTASQDIYNNYYNLVYLTGLQDSLQNRLRNNDNSSISSYIIRYLNEAKQKRLKLEEFIQNLKTSNNINDGNTQAFKYLPKTFKPDNENTLIALTLIVPDSQTIPEEDLILIDLLSAYRLGNEFDKYLGHELHHLYVLNYFSKLRKNDELDRYPDLIYSIDKLRLEGIADLIDKDDILEKPNKSDYELDFCKYYKESKSRFQKMDYLIQEIVDNESMFTANGKKISRELPLGCHPNGLYMAHLIEREYGKDGILKCLENPFVFIQLFNEASKQNPEKYYTFSDVAMNYLKKLELEWIED